MEKRPRRGVVIVWLVLAVLVVTIAAIEINDRRRASSRANERDARLLVSVPMDQLGAVEIADRGRLHRFERDASGAWFYHGVHAEGTAAHTHPADPALSARIEQALGAFGRARMERSFTLDRDGSAYGLATPDTVILVYRPKESQPLAQYAVGALAPDTVSRYVLLVGSPVVVTIPQYHVANLLELVQAASGSADPGTTTRQ